jgi:Zn-dependent protease
VYSGVLKNLAAAAQEQASADDPVRERDTWSRALALLPSDTQQHSEIRTRIAALDAAVAQRAQPAAKPAASGPWWKRGAASAAAVVLLALGKLKFLLLGLTKASTFFSMFAFFGVYWTAYGWPLALGLVVSIYIHEMGHVAMLRRLGIDAGAPLFIPGLGAMVMLKQHVDDPVTDAKVGLAGPVWGLGVGLTAYAVGATLKSPTWLAIAQLTGYINLFNLIPVWQLDGSRGFHALGRAGRWTVVAATLVMGLATEQPLLVIIGACGVFRAFQPTKVRTDRMTLATFVVLLVSLSLLAQIAPRG